VKSNKIFITFVALIILFLSYLLIPNIYDKDEISKQLKNQLLNKFDLTFNFSSNLKYNFFPRPHFIYKGPTILKEQNEISKIEKLKIYVSLNNLFSLDNVKINDLILENANFNLNNQTYDFFTKFLDKNFKNSNFIIKNSNIFYRNKENEVLFINKIINLKYYYDVKVLRNIFISKNEIFNLPYSVKLYQNEGEKKIVSKINSNFLKLQIENELDYSSDVKKGSINLILNQNKSNVTYELDKKSLNFNLFDKLENSNFSYNGKVNFNPFYSKLEGTTNKIDLFHLFSSNGSILQLLKTEILNNKNLNFDLNIYADKIKNLKGFIKFFLNSKIQEGLIDIDNSKFSWGDDVDFSIMDSLIYVKDGELILDGILDLTIKNSEEIYKFLLTPKNYRTELKKVEVSFIYNFDQKIINLDNIRIDNKGNKEINEILKNLTFKSNGFQNKVYLKGILNKIIMSYAG
jgi:disulfide oxidoreductase YuzD